MPEVREQRDDQVSLTPDGGQVDLPTTPVSEVQAHIPDGAASADAGQGRGAGRDDAWTFFREDAERQGLTMTEYRKKYGIIKPSFDPFNYKEVTMNPDMLEKIVDGEDDE